MALPPQERDTLLLAMVESLGMLPSRIDYELEAIDPDTTIQNRIRNSTRREQFARLVTKGVDREFDQDQIGTGSPGDQLYQKVLQTVSQDRLSREEVAEGILGLLRPLLRSQISTSGYPPRLCGS